MGRTLGRMVTCPNCGRESPEDFAFCPACSTPLSPAAPAREVRKTVSIVFCDVTGSTALGEQLDPSRMRDVQSRYFDTMRAAIERHGGTVEKYIGDAVMAVFGIPVLHEDDALRAARAAADMRDGARGAEQGARARPRRDDPGPDRREHRRGRRGRSPAAGTRS